MAIGQRNMLIVFGWSKCGLVCGPLFMEFLYSLLPAQNAAHVAMEKRPIEVRQPKMKLPFHLLLLNRSILYIYIYIYNEYVVIYEIDKLGNIYIKHQLGFDIGHIEMFIDQINNKIRVPWIFIFPRIIKQMEE